MTQPTNPSDDFHPIDDLVRQHVEREVAGVNARKVLARVRAQRATPRSRGWRMLVMGLVVGAGVGAAVAVLTLTNLGRPTQPGLAVNEVQAATPADLVRGVFFAHSDNTDRLYDVKVELGNTARITKKYPSLSPPAHLSLIKDSKLWVRGNQFWVDPSGPSKPMRWGRDRDGRVWMALDRRTGLQYSRDEENEPVTRLCNLMSLRVPTLAAEMLDEYELSQGEISEPEAPIRVVGKIRNSPREIAVSHVMLEIDPRTKVIRKAVQKRTIGSELLGTFTYTLVETGRIPDTQYELRGHLEPGSKVLDAKDKAGRNDLFNRYPWKKF